MADTTQAANLDAVISMLQGGLSSIDPEAAVDAIEVWQQQLHGTEMAETLGELKLAIDGGTRSGEIGTILRHLGSQASKASSAESGAAASKLQQLGQMLSEAGSSIG